MSVGSVAFGFDPQTAAAYRLYYVDDRSIATEDEAELPVLPVVFVHGHRGAYGQANALAAQLQSEFAFRKGTHPAIGRVFSRAKSCVKID